MKISIRSASAIIVAAFALTIAGAPPALAVPSSVSIGWNAAEELFHGKVSSNSDECIAHRPVKVFERTAAGPQLVGRVLTNNRGGWRLSAMAHDGDFFAKVREQTIMSVNCAGDRSRLIHVM